MSVEVVRVAGIRAYPPRVTAFTRLFWEALPQGRFTTTRCDACRRFSFPPKEFCPHCWSRDVAWVELSGRGRLYGVTTIHAAPTAFRDEVPYRVGIIDLEEDVRLATQLTGDGTARLDSSVRLVALLYDDGPLFAAHCG